MRVVRPIVEQLKAAGCTVPEVNNALAMLFASCFVAQGKNKQDFLKACEDAYTTAGGK